MLEAVTRALPATPAEKDDGFTAHVEKVFEELTGKKLAATPEAAQYAQLLHARAHGRA